VCLVAILYCLACVGACRESNGLEREVKMKLSGRDESGFCGDDLTWTFSAEDQTLTIEGSGEIYDYYGGSDGWENFRPQIRSIIIKRGVTSIGAYAFKGCTNLTELIIPSSVTSIGYWAFAECISLASVDIPSSVTSIGFSAFDGCSSLESVNLRARLDNIGPSTFSECISLSHIDIPSTVSSIGASAFEGCTSLESVVIPKGTTTIGNGAFSGCSSLKIVNISETVTSIGSGAFDLCTSLTDFFVDSENSKYLSDNGVLIGKEWSQLIQYPCGRNGNYTIPNTVFFIEDGAFFQCHGLTSVIVPDHVKSIGASAFEGCSNLSSVTILSDDITILDGAFSSCNKLSEIILSENNNNYYQVKEGVLFSKDGSTLKQYPCGLNDTYVIPAGVIYIGYDAFNGCNSLKQIIIPSSVTSIGNSAFKGCNSLRYVTFQSSVGGLNSAFTGCNNLIAINYLGDSDPGVESDPFISLESLELLCVPSNYSNNTLFTRNDIFRTDSCVDIFNQINECYGVVLAANGTSVLGLRNNVSVIEEERKKCVNTTCRNATAKALQCMGGKKQICDSDVCIDCEQCDERKWTVVIETSGVNESSTQIVKDISDATDVDPNKISIKVETDDNGQIVNIIVFVSDKKDADKIQKAANACAARPKNVKPDDFDIAQHNNV